VALPRPSASLVRRLAVASVVANSAIVVTGGVVRLTGSGLGCPTWPSCTDESYTPTAEYAEHGAIEFGNRMLTFVVGLVALATLVAVLRHGRRSLVPLAVAAFLGIPAQAVLGGITVLTGLNPWTVAAHLLLSMAIIAVTVALAWRAARPDGALPAPTGPPLGRELTWLVRLVVGVVAVVLALGTVVTGSGPHAGDEVAARTGFDPETVSQLHADAVMLLVGLTVAAVLWLRAARAPAEVRRAAVVLLGVELAQGLVGFVQYFTGLPVVLVGAHLLGACLVWIAAVRLLLATTAREVPAPAAPAGPAAPAAPAGSAPPAPARSAYAAT
jgi:cytochrome c oxidase assembly protein subunit 15